MRIRKTRQGLRIGDAIVDYSDRPAIQDAARAVVETDWSKDAGTTPIGEREPVYENERVIVVPGSRRESVFCYFIVDEDVIEVPDFQFVIKMLQLL